MRELEDELGVRLFDRLGRTVVLTAAGHVLEEHARRLFLILEDARIQIGELAGPSRSHNFAVAAGSVRSDLRLVGAVRPTIFHLGADPAIFDEQGKKRAGIDVLERPGRIAGCVGDALRRGASPLSAASLR